MSAASIKSSKHGGKECVTEKSEGESPQQNGRHDQSSMDETDAPIRTAEEQRSAASLPREDSPSAASPSRKISSSASSLPREDSPSAASLPREDSPSAASQSRKTSSSAASLPRESSPSTASLPRETTTPQNNQGMRLPSTIAFCVTLMANKVDIIVCIDKLHIKSFQIFCRF